jgi:7-carboxy-7-deazaguanine synthase
MHFELLRELIHILHIRGRYVTVETAGSYLIEDLNIDLVSLSPKMNNSVPKLSNTISQVVIDRHNKFRTNYDAMKLLIIESRDYQIKFVISDIIDLDEVKEFQAKLNIPNNKIYLMPEGIESEQIISKHLWLLDYCIEYGYNLCDRLQIRYYGNKREA